MSLLLNSGPRKKKSWSSGGREELDFEDLARKAKASKKWIHPKLRFEEVVKNKTLPVRNTPICPLASPKTNPPSPNAPLLP